MARINIKTGDVFSVDLDNGKKFFQYVADDTTQLNSNVIRVFKKLYLLNENPNSSEIVQDQIDFYAHCMIKLGVKMGLWKKCGHSTSDINIDEVLFRNTNDYGAKAGEEPIRLSTNWYIWRINDKSFTKIGALKGEYRNAEIGIVLIPKDIVDRMKDGNYHFRYPDFC